MKLLKLVLEKSHFVFKEEFFHQIAGNAMGTIVIPTICNISIGIPGNSILRKV